jgi:hypothetical protein
MIPEMEERPLPTSSKPFVDILEEFNRKERNLLVRDILGHSEEKLRLSDDFLKRIHDATGVTLDADAWWATDFHFDWLFAAAMLFVGTATAGQVQADAIPPLMTATQEDADLVVADGKHLILIEAKAYGSFSNERIKEKRRRFNQLRELFGSSLDLHLVLMSPVAPQKLHYPEGIKPLPWLQLMIGANVTVCRVERCDASGNTGKAGGHWTIVELPAPKAADGGKD